MIYSIRHCSPEVDNTKISYVEYEDAENRYPILFHSSLEYVNEMMRKHERHIIRDFKKSSSVGETLNEYAKKWLHEKIISGSDDFAKGPAPKQKPKPKIAAK